MIYGAGDSRKPVRLEHLSWTRIRDLQAGGCDMLLLPLGATEQHGPHLPINTDTVIATAACDYASAVTGVPVLPALSYTVSAGHTEKWPGTFSIFHETFIHTLREIAAWAVATGWKRLLLVNSHFGNDASLRVAVDRLRFDYVNRLQIATRNTFSLTPSIWEYFISDAADLHANKAETDLMLHLAPETVDMSVAEDDPDRTTETIFNYMVANTSLNGVTGNPTEGTAARGKLLFEEIGEALAAIVEKARRETAPVEWQRTAGVF
ncbi:MAG: creatininase family protein [Verrucomicrobia bacterium]|nr:creatininase family protein [Verrucomicrobiota bacterium]